MLKMGGNGSSGSAIFTDSLTIIQALEIARESEEGARNPSIRSILERAITNIWERLQAQPNTYILLKEEFAVFNYYRESFGTSPLAQAAVKRFWDNYPGDPSDLRGI